MTNVCIVGVGLIGGSLGMALRRVRKNGRRVYQVTGLGRSASRLKKARRLGAVDRFALRPKEAVEKADAVVLCVPVQSIAPMTRLILPFLKPGAVVTDAGSVKEKIVRDVVTFLKRRPDVQWSGAHPIAGSEKTGVEHARPDLFKKAVCVLTTDGASPVSVKKAGRLWSDAGCRCVRMTAKVHDRILSLTSHVPHLMAFGLFSAALEARKTDRALFQMAAGSFRDVTRIAASDPAVWTGIFELNRAQLKISAERVMKAMGRLLRAPSNELKKTLQSLSRQKTSLPL